MKTLKTIFSNKALILLVAIALSSCSSTDDTGNDVSSLTEKETYSIEISGTHPTLPAINSKIEIL